MSGRGSGGGPSRGAGGPTQTTWARDGVGAILVVLAVGLAFRLLIVKVYGGTGLEFDLGSFWGWADNLASQGLNGFYQRDFFHDYTPGYLYVLYAVGLLSQAISGGAGHIGDMIKLPPILADVAIGWLVWSMAIEIGASRRAALVGAAIAVANPISWFDSVTWGQVDSFGVVFLLLGLRELTPRLNLAGESLERLERLAQKRRKLRAGRRDELVELERTRTDRLGLAARVSLDRVCGLRHGQKRLVQRLLLLPVPRKLGFTVLDPFTRPLEELCHVLKELISFLALVAKKGSAWAERRNLGRRRNHGLSRRESDGFALRIQQAA